MRRKRSTYIEDLRLSNRPSKMAKPTLVIISALVDDQFGPLLCSFRLSVMAEMTVRDD